MFTFVILAHNEEASVVTITRQALDAKGSGDRVLVVDSGSTDLTAQRAANTGAEVIRGPLGKGAAIAYAMSRLTTEWVCFLDADLFASDVNVPAALRTTATSADVDHVLGDYEYSTPGTILSSTFTIYEPLVAELFPEVAGALGANALTGYRAVRRKYLDRGLPTDFGIEAYLNVSVALAGGTAAVRHLGVVESRFRYKASMGREIARPVLDLAVAHGRLHPDQRPAWQDWVEEGLSVVASIRGAETGQSAALQRLFAAVRRPMPAKFPI